MNRRRFLTTIAAGCSTGAAGCVAENGSKESNPASATKGTASTAHYRTPEIVNADLVTHWKPGGNLESNSIKSVGRGGIAKVAFKYRMPSRQGKVDLTAQATVYDEDGLEQTRKQQQMTYLVAPDGYAESDGVFQFDTQDWSKQRYTVEVIVREEITDQTSQGKQTTFEVVEPLHNAEAEVVREEIFNSPDVGETIDFRVEFRNTTSRDSSIVSTLSKRRGVDDFSELEKMLKFNISGDEERWWEPSGWVYDGRYYYRIDAIDDLWELKS